MSETRKAKIKQDFIDARGYWSRGWDPLLDIAPEARAAACHCAPAVALAALSS